MSAKQRFGRAQRLSGRNVFARVFGGRHSAADKLIVVYAMPNGLAYARLGLTVGRKVGKAVIRNRIKRLLREAFRLENSALPKGYDLVCIPRPGIEGTLVGYRRALRLVSIRAANRCESARRKRTDS
ncbi:MAG: ribonuclease P protein component [Phycisphaerales bacterium]|nr:ribonuclease P protein component [Phycisphaerales bacterium]